MRCVYSLMVVCSVCLGLVGCTSSTDVSDPQGTGVVQTSATQTVDAGCASCIFNMEGIEECQLAVKIDEKTYLVSGADVDAHESGLCDSVKKAVVAGNVEGDKFVATSFQLQP